MVKMDTICINIRNHSVFDVLLNNYGHMEMGPPFKDASERLEKPWIKLVTPCLQGKNPNHLNTGPFNKNLKC